MRKAVVTGVMLGTLALAGCQTSSQVGIITRPSGDPGAVIRIAQPYHELGLRQGKTCRYFLLAVIPWGDGTVAKALDEALTPVGGDALINVLVTSSLFTFIPYFNIFSFGCTTVQGVAVAYDNPPAGIAPVDPVSAAPATTY